MNIKLTLSILLLFLLIGLFSVGNVEGYSAKKLDTASKYCIFNGYDVYYKNMNNELHGYCILDKIVCDVWDYFYGFCGYSNRLNEGNSEIITKEKVKQEKINDFLILVIKP